MEVAYHADDRGFLLVTTISKGHPYRIGYAHGPYSRLIQHDLPFTGVLTDKLTCGQADVVESGKRIVQASHACALHFEILRFPLPVDGSGTSGSFGQKTVITCEHPADERHLPDPIYNLLFRIVGIEEGEGGDVASLPAQVGMLQIVQLFHQHHRTEDG